MFLNNNFLVHFDFLTDVISYSFMLLTVTIALFVYIFTFSYFRYEPNVERLLVFLNSFVISMVFLVNSGNFIMLFLGWEMIGVTSFFLINFWATRVGTLKSAFKAYSFNKSSDFFLFFGILIIFVCQFDLDFLNFLSQSHLLLNYKITFLLFDLNVIDFISFFFLCSAFIKSAQIGAHIWLPDSMEAPVPASALIHSATLVSAGIYLLLRFNFLFEMSSYAYYIVPLVGCITAFYGGFVSMYQSDVKKILAYSTISHCGFLMVLWSTNVLEYVILYLYVHGFFKATTFMCVGNVIRFSKNYQDFRRMGLFYKFLPFECLAGFVCLINLCGLPFTFGFFIKHLLFVGVHEQFFLYYFIITVSLLAAVTGIFYSFRLFYYVFFDFKKAKKSLYNYSNKNILNSKYYSNTSLASNIAITLSVFVSYCISLVFFCYFLNKNYNFGDFNSYLVSLNELFFFYADANKLFNFSFLNWFVIFLIVGVLFSKWRVQLFNFKHFFNFFNILLFFIFFFLIFSFL